MYNSYTVNGLSKIWNIINEFYEYSVLKEVIKAIVCVFQRISRGSHVISFFTNNDSLIEKSGIYSIYKKIIFCIESIFCKLRGLVAKYKQKSLINSTVDSTFGSVERTIETISLFAITFSIVNIALDMLFNEFLTYENIALLIIIFISVITYRYRANIKDMVLNSFIIKLVIDVFTIDNGGDQWW